MCYINWRPDPWAFAPPTPGLRPLPRFGWVTPINIVELDAILEVYLKQIEQNTTLRLCHRFGDGPLSKLPQEILDHIISERHESAKEMIRSKWNQNYRCFQGRCTPGQHLEPGESITEEIWQSRFVDNAYSYGHSPRNAQDFTEEQKLEMVGRYLEEDGYDPYDEYLWDIHDGRQNAWLNQICLCRQKDNSDTKKGSAFPSLTNLLKSHFGLEAIILHEVLSDNMINFLPDASNYADCSYYSTCFLGLSSPTRTADQSHDRVAPHQNDAFLKADNHFAFHQIIDPTQLNITKKQKLSFARAIRILGLQPYYHLNELHACLRPENDEEDLWAICHNQLKGCPKPSSKSRSEKKRLLHEYIRSKSQELSKQSWPQFMIMSTSDAIAPS